MAEEGRTVLFSSHLLDEVERVADHVVMLQHGRVVLNGRTDDVRGEHISAVLAFAEPPAKAPVVAGAHAVSGYGSEWRVLFGGSHLELETAAALIGAGWSRNELPRWMKFWWLAPVGKGANL